MPPPPLLLLLLLLLMMLPTGTMTMMTLRGCGGWIDGCVN
jgi:hypothetical protein